MKKNNNIYNIVFLISRFITCFILCFTLFCIINVKFSISENLFEFLVSSFLNIYSGDRPFFQLFSKTYVFYLFFTLWNIYLCLYFIILLVLSFIIKYFFKRNITYILLILINTLFMLIVFNHISIKINILFLGIFILLIILFFFYINFYVRGNNILRYFSLIPIIGDFLLPKYVFHKSSLLILIVLFFSVNTMAVLFFPISIDVYNLSRHNKLKIVHAGNIHSLSFDNSNRLVTRISNNKILILNNVNDNKSINIIKYRARAQEICYNKHNHKFYMYDELTSQIVVFDDNFNLIQNEIIPENMPDPRSYERLCCDFCGDNVAISLEKGKFYILDSNTLHIKLNSNIPTASDYVTYNKFLSSYMISFWHKRKYFMYYLIKENKFIKINAPEFQGFFAISERNKELYLAFIQKGRIYVYDAETLKLKRKIKTQFTVRNIYYDEELNILIAPGYFTGYVDIFLMDGSDRLLCSEYIDFEIRDAIFDNTKQYLFITSRLGLYKKKIDIVKLIDKYKNK